ncbi:MAG TPA: hypothetical protein VKU35_00740 [Candidatus Limnocylindria bacterium]|nr:hypothetical protein [Candidatus Limnocylindria bacterium]
MLTPTETSGGQWSVELEPSVLLPSRDAHAAVTFTPDRELNARSVRARLTGTERYRYRRTESDGKTSRTVEHTGSDEVGRVDTILAGPVRLAAGQPVSWAWTFHVPDLGPASFEGGVLRCDWELAVHVDMRMALDPHLRQPVHVAQPSALLQAGVVDAGAYALFEEAPINVDAHPAQLKLEPVPLCIERPYRGVVTIETPDPVPVQEVRLELRVHATVTVAGGEQEEILVSQGHLDADGGSFGGPLASHPFTADPPGLWLPTLDLPHGRARAVFHVILARAWARDVHYVRDVALCTTTEL